MGKTRKIYVGDPCYVFKHTDEGFAAWEKFIRQENMAKPYELEGGIIVAAEGTANGDGVYRGENSLTKKSHAFPVDAGLIGYVDLTNAKKDDPRFENLDILLKDKEDACGVVVETESSNIHLSEHGGTIRVERWVIETDYDDDWDDEEEDDQWDDGDDEDDFDW